VSLARQLDMFTGGLLSGLIDQEVKRELKKKECPVCRDTFKTKQGKDCFYCKKPVDKTDPAI